MSSGFNPPDAALLAQLKELVGLGGWVSPSDGERFFDDPRGRFHGKACLILLPESTDQVARIVRLCNTSKVGIVPISGGTGVVAGQLSTESEHAIVVSLERMNRVRELSVDDGVVVVEAGCILEDIHKVARAAELMFPLSMASKGSCCIGGNLATNAGGIQVVRHGNARDLCLGIEAVLPCGSIYSDLSPLRKDNTGYDLRHLLIGSEGTLGIITAATLVLKPQDPESVTVLCAVESPRGALQLFRHLRRDLGDSLSALELLSDVGLRLVTHFLPALNQPFEEPYPWYLLIEASGPAGVGERLETSLAVCLEQAIVLDAVIAQSQTQQENLWGLRENMPEANRRGGAFCNSDTSVPISKVEPFIQRTHQLIHALHPEVRINSYGHIGDGNIHHNVLPPLGCSKQEFVRANPDIIEQTRIAVNEATQAFHGSISAEHGIGRLKTRDLESFADQTKLAALRCIKQAMDPNNIMNPGAVVV